MHPYAGSSGSQARQSSGGVGGESGGQGAQVQYGYGSPAQASAQASQAPRPTPATSATGQPQQAYYYHQQYPGYYSSVEAQQQMQQQMQQSAQQRQQPQQHQSQQAQQPQQHQSQQQQQQEGHVGYLPHMYSYGQLYGQSQPMAQGQSQQSPQQMQFQQRQDYMYMLQQQQQQQQQLQQRQQQQSQHQPAQQAYHAQHQIPGQSQTRVPHAQIQSHTNPQILQQSHSSSNHEQSGASATVTDMTGQIAPPGIRPKVTTTLWEDEGTLCFQVEVRSICVARREDNDFINGTKLLNVAGMTRGRRDGLLKGERSRHVVKAGAMHLKGVWIPYDRALDFANKEKITDLLYPLFVTDIRSVLYQPGTVGSRAVAQPPSVTPQAPHAPVVGTDVGGAAAAQVHPGRSPNMVPPHNSATPASEQPRDQPQTQVQSSTPQGTAAATQGTREQGDDAPVNGAKDERNYQRSAGQPPYYYNTASGQYQAY